MAIQKIHIFSNFAVSAEDLNNPEGELEGRALVIQDHDTGDVYRIPFVLDAAKKVGQYLMGIGAVHVANGADIHKIKGTKS